MKVVTRVSAVRVVGGGAQVKLIEKTESAGGIAAFLEKAVEPPAPAAIANAVGNLKAIGALTCAQPAPPLAPPCMHVW